MDYVSLDGVLWWGDVYFNSNCDCCRNLPTCISECVVVVHCWIAYSRLILSAKCDLAFLVHILNLTFLFSVAPASGHKSAVTSLRFNSGATLLASGSQVSWRVNVFFPTYQ